MQNILCFNYQFINIMKIRCFIHFVWMLLLAGSLTSCVERKSGVDEAKVHVLASFEDGQTTPFTASAPDAVVVETPYSTHGKKALKFSSGNIAWTNANEDWQEYDFLLADVYLEGDNPMDVEITIFDIESDNYWTRVNYPAVLVSGKNTLKMPLSIAVGEKSRPGRPLRKDAITRVGFTFSSNGNKDSFVYLDHLRVEQDAPDQTWFDGLKAFSFGNPRLSLMGGFTRVTSDSEYSTEQGYGWKDARLSYPLDPFQPDILYRSTINISSGDFILDLPNGKYRVFMNIDAPNGFWGEIPIYRNRKVFANGKEVVNDNLDKKTALEKFFRYVESEDLYEENVFDKYVTSHYNEKEFEVDVTDGQLKLSFQTGNASDRSFRSRGDNSAISLSALIVYPAKKQKEGKKFLAKVVERRRENFENTFRKVLHVDSNPEPQLSQAQNKQGYVVFSRPMEEDIFPNTIPLVSELADNINAFGAAGTVEPLAFAIRSYKDFGQVAVTAGDFTTEDGKKIPSGAIQVGYVSNRLTRLEMGGSKYTVAPRYLMNKNRISLPVNTTRWFWAVFDVPENAGKGIYKGEFTLTFSNGEKGTLPASFEVVYDRPLPKIDVPTGPWGIEIRASTWYQEEMGDFNQKVNRSSFELLRKSGFTTFTSGLRLRPEGKGKDLILHFDFADSLMNLAKEYGMTAFVNYGAFVNGMNVYGYPNPTNPADFGFDNPDAMWKHLVALIDKHSQEKQWLPVFVSTSDEPHILSDQEKCAALNKILKKYQTPRIRFAGISSITERNANSYHQEFCESMDVANLNIHDQWAIDMLHKAGSDWAFYNGGNRWTFGPYMYMLKQKNNMLFRVSWHWNCNSGDPYYALDGREDDYCWANITPEGELITSVSFERLRRGIVDYRYLLALKEFAAKQPSHPLAKDAKALLDEVLALKPATDRGSSEAQTKKMFQRSQDYRDKAIKILKSL